MYLSLCFDLLQYKDLLQSMIEAIKDDQMKLTDEQIVAHSTTFLLAGYETTSNTLAYVSYLLALNPIIQEKLQQEIDNYFDNNPVSKIHNVSVIANLPPATFPGGPTLRGCSGDRVPGEGHTGNTTTALSCWKVRLP